MVGLVERDTADIPAHVGQHGASSVKLRRIR
jgi:hypothetical protein